MADTAGLQQKPSGFGSMLRRLSSTQSLPPTKMQDDVKPKSSSSAPMKGYKPRYADRDAMLCVATKDRPDVTQKTFDWRRRNQRPSTAFDQSQSDFRTMPQHPNHRISMGGMPSYIPPPLSRTPQSPTSSTSSSRAWSVETPSDDWSLDWPAQTSSASARLEDNSRDYFGERELKKLSLAELRREIRASMKDPHGSQIKKQTLSVPSSRLDSGHERQTYFLPTSYSGKGKQKVGSPRVPSVGHYRSPSLQHKRFSPANAAVNGRLTTTPEEIEMEEMATPERSVSRQSSSRSSTGSTLTLSTVATPRQTSDADTVEDDYLVAVTTLC